MTWTFSRFLSAAFFAMFGFSACGAPAEAADAVGRTITTRGESIIYVVPDKAVITVAVDTFAANLGEAEKANETRGRQFVDAIEKLGIDPKQVATDDVSISIVYRDYTGRKQSDIDGYRTVRQYTVTVSDTKSVQKIIDTAVANGANTLSGVQYEDTQSRKHRDEARKMAAKAAKEKAVELAAVLDCQVAAPRKITENALPVSGFFGNMYSNSGGSADRGEAPATEEDNSLPPGQLEVRGSVTVEFDLADAPSAKP